MSEQLHHVPRRQLLGGALGLCAGMSLWESGPAGAAPPITRPGEFADRSLSSGEHPGWTAFESRRMFISPFSFQPMHSGIEFDFSTGALTTSTGGTFVAASWDVVAAIDTIAVRLDASPGPGKVTVRVMSIGGVHTEMVSTWRAGEEFGFESPATPLVPPIGGGLEVIAELAPGTSLRSVEVITRVPRSGLIRLDTPVRIFDSRPAGGWTPITTGRPRSIGFKPLLPLTAYAVVNLTFTNTTRSGYLTIDSGDTSNLNWDGPGQTRSNLAICNQAGLHLNGMEALVVGGPSDFHIGDLIVDLVGWFQGY